MHGLVVIVLTHVLHKLFLPLSTWTSVDVLVVINEQQVWEEELPKSYKIDFGLRLSFLLFFENIVAIKPGFDVFGRILLQYYFHLSLLH